MTDLGELLEADGERNRFRGTPSPLPGSEVQEIGLLILSPQLDAKISHLAGAHGMSAGEIITRALDLFEKENQS